MSSDLRKIHNSYYLVYNPKEKKKCTKKKRGEGGPNSQGAH